MRSYKILFLTPLLGLFFMGCSVQFTMSGASIPEELKTFSVQYFVNRAPVVNPTLSQTFVEALKDRISNESRLILVKDGGDCDFTGEITGYSTKPMAIQADAQSAETRFTMTVKVRYKNYRIPKLSWEQSFSAYKNYPSEGNFSNLESDLVRNVTDQITENIFNKAFSDW